MSTFGVSNPVEIPPEKFAPRRRSDKFTEVPPVKLTVLGKSAELSPPELSDGDRLGAGILMNGVNPFPERAFEKISIPQYGSSETINGTGKTPLARYTGVPYAAEFIKDYHVISLLRLSDKLINPSYLGKIKKRFESPSPSQ